MTKPRIGVIGFQMGGNIAQAMYNLTLAEFVAGSDLDPTARARVELLGGAFYTDYRRMLETEQLDGVVIALPHYLHAPVAEMAAAKGCHLYIEKPLAHTVEDCDRIITAANAHGVRILVGFQLRYLSAVQKARELVRNGALGTIVGVTMVEGGIKHDEYFAAAWKGSRAQGGGPLYMNATHTIDRIRYILGEITAVSAALSHAGRGLTAEDTASAILKFANGAIGTFFITDTAVIGGMAALMIAGSKAALSLFPLKFYGYHWPWNPREQMGLSVETIELHTETVDPTRAIIERFNAVIAGAAEPLTTAADARQTTAVIQAIIAAGESNAPVELAGGRP